MSLIRWLHLIGGTIGRTWNVFIGWLGISYASLSLKVDLGFETYMLLIMAFLKILNEPSTLITQILKAKYFLNSSFLDVVVWLNASYVWRSICAAREVIQHYSRWQIGDGSLVRVWHDHWLPSPSIFQISSPRPSNCDISLVQELITSEAKWDMP